MSPDTLDNQEATARPAGQPRWVLFIAAVAIIVLAAAAVAVWLGMWFADSDADWLLWAANAPAPVTPGPVGSAVGWAAKPVAAAAWWGAFRAFGWRYGLYQLAHVLMWFGVLVAYGVMLRQLWGPRRRPALAATVMVAFVLVGFSEQVLHLEPLLLTCELLLGLTSVALAAAGWRYRRWWFVLGGWLLLAGACAGSLPTASYLFCLHVAAASTMWRRRSMRSWVVLVILGSAAVAVVSVWWVGVSIPSMSAVGALDRWLAFRDTVTTGPAALLLGVLAAIAGLIQGTRQQMRSWPMIAAMGAVLALTSLTLHPLLVVLALTLMTPAAWPFAVWAVVQQIAILLDLAPLSQIQITAMFAYVPVFVISIWRSPVAVWAGRFARRIDPTGRKLIYSATALIAVLLAAHSGEWLDQHSRVLRTLGRRRQLHRELLYQVVATVPQSGAVSLVTYAEMGTSRHMVEQMSALSRAHVLLSFTPVEYGRLLAARGREDIRVVPLGEIRTTGGWLLVTSRREMQAATNVLGSLGTPQMTLSTDDIVSGLWRIQRRTPTPPKPPPTTTPAADSGSSTRPADSPAL